MDKESSIGEAHGEPLTVDGKGLLQSLARAGRAHVHAIVSNAIIELVHRYGPTIMTRGVRRMTCHAKRLPSVACST